MKINELEQLNTAQQIFESFSRNTDPKTAQYMRNMYENFTLPFIASLQSKSILTEAQLTSQQITDIFQQAEQGMADLGANRSFLGKGADVASAAGQDLAAAGQGAANLAKKGAKGAVDLAKKGAEGVKQLADKILAKNKANFEKNLPPADAGPVQNFEQQAQEAAAQIQDPKAKQGVMDLIKQGVKNPVAQTLILTAVSGIAGIVAGPAIAGLGLPLAATAALTGSVVGGLTGLVRGKMQGKGWKDAGMDALKGAGMGAAVGGLGGAIAQGAQAVAQGLQQHHAAQQAQAQDGQSQFGKDFKLPNDVQAKNNEVQNSAAQEWANASPAEKLQIQSVTGMSSDQLDQLSKNPLPTTFPDSQPDLGKFDKGTGQGWDAGGAQKHTAQSIGPDTPSDGSYRQAAPIGRDGQPMQQVPMDDETPIKNQADLDNYVQQSIDAGKTPTGNDGSDFSQSETNAPIHLDPKVQDLANQEAAKYGRTTPNQNDIKAAQIMSRNTLPTGNAYIDQLNRAAANGIRLREYIDSRQTARAWLLRESLGRERGGVALTEAGIAAVFEGLGDYFKNMGKNLTNKVTVDKLKSAWQKADMPDDSEQIAAILQKAGVGKSVINGIFNNMGIPSVGATGGADADADSQVNSQKPGFFGRIGQSMRANKAGKQAAAVNKEVIDNQLRLWQMAAQGIDPSDVAGYQQTMSNWANKNFPSAGQQAIAGAVKQVDPNNGSSITQAITDIVNTSMRNRATGGTPTNNASTTTPAAVASNAGDKASAALAGNAAAGNTPAEPEAPAADTNGNDAEAENEPANAPNPFGQMTGQLKSYAPPEKTSTGGTLTQTPTGQVHKANPNNPNAQANQAAAANQQQQQAPQTPQPKRSVTGDVPVPDNFGQTQQAQSPPQGQAPQGQAPQAATPQPRQSLKQKIAARGQTPQGGNTAGKPQWTGRPKVQATTESFTRDFGAMLWKRMKDGK
jgi:hypothetical protein